MFRQRNSQKPAEDLLENFRQQFPDLATTACATTAPTLSQTAAPENPMLNLPPVDSHGAQPPLPVNSSFQDHDPTPRATNEPWRFTPSLLDPNSFSFNQFANSPPGPQGYYNPTPGVVMPPHGLGTPLSMQASGTNPIHSHSGPAVVDMAGFQSLPAHQIHHFDPFAQSHPHPPQPSFAPPNYVHQDSNYERMEQDISPPTSDPSDERLTSLDNGFQTASPIMKFQPRQNPGSQMAHPLPSYAEKFRYYATLNAPTAMVRHADEIPVSYLNKGQVYSLAIVDTNSTLSVQPGARYRTFVRVSFEDDEQRVRPNGAWSLWKEGRGQNEAHQRGGRLQAVEYVETAQQMDGDDKRTRVELEASSFDGFSFIWTPGARGSADVNVSVRFNFLSTDFSHSKGVKGIPVRFCAKTVMIASGSKPVADESGPEICFCKVKLFRDHGAERKLANDVTHVKKAIDKVKHQITQAETGLKDCGKRRRAGSIMKKTGKTQRHKRTWSMSSMSSVDGGGGGGSGLGRSNKGDDLHMKLKTYQDMFTSTKPISVLCLRGEELDDPDMHPVTLPADHTPPYKQDMARDGSNWHPRSARSSNAGSMVSPSPSSLSLVSQASAIGQGGQWQNMEAIATGDKSLDQQQPTKVNRTDTDGKLNGWIEAVGVDPSYQPPPERFPKPAACFYIRLNDKGEPKHSGPGYHRAVYLMQRTLNEFNQSVAGKWGLAPTKIRRTVHAVQGGLEIEMDDDYVHELKEGQDMTLEIEELAKPIKREWEMAVDSNENPEQQRGAPSGYLLRLTF